MTDVVKPEDTSRLKRFDRLRFKEVSAVTRGGHQGAAILIKRNKESPVSFLSKLLETLKPAAAAATAETKPEEVKRSDDEGEAPTTSEILRANELRQKMYRVNGAFEESMYRIMSKCSGKELVKKLKTSVDEYGTEMDRCFSESSTVQRNLDVESDLNEIGRKLVNIATIAAKDDLTDADIEEVKRNLDPKNDKTSHSVERGATLPTPTPKESPMSLLAALKNATPAEIEEAKRTLGMTAPATPSDPIAVLRSAIDTTDAKVVTALNDITAKLTATVDANKVLVERLDALEADKKNVADLAAAKEFMPFLPEAEALNLVRSGSDALKTTVRGAMERAKVPNLMLERGASLPGGSAGSATLEITRKAQELVAADPSKFSTLAEARVHVRDTSPELAARERAEG